MKDEFLATALPRAAHARSTRSWAGPHAPHGRPARRRHRRPRASTPSTATRSAQTQLIEDILDVSRIVAGKLRLDVRAGRPRPRSSRRRVDTVRPAADAKGIRLRRELDRARRPRSTGDPDRLQQVVWNLALQRRSSSRPRRTGASPCACGRSTRTSSSRSRTRARASSADFLPHVFERFRQADDRGTASHGGLGPGPRHRAAPRRAARRHRARGERRRGRGRDLHRAPAADAPRARTTRAARWRARRRSPSQRPVPRRRARPGGRRRGGRARAPRTVLEQLGRGRAPRSAPRRRRWPRWTRERPDVLISDIEMPGEDGYALHPRACAPCPPEQRRQRRPPPRSPPTRAPRTACARCCAGFQLHLPKPVQPAELAAVVASLAGRKPEA